ncbi:hypothetical protein C7212DRAFT_279213 [Tuber magnatum]|uniref:Uncharacterized protein n=1 Tax=Tuber magnatum TaxID=42249 RepID=A0A317SUW6_9PEZI|nr:hypothetical protein C7212DRAFT_279213 [Tuber magnatum]
MHPSPFPQTSGPSGSRPVNFARNQITPTASGAHTGETDSWIEVASHPSDSAYTSSSDEHIITAGLQVSAARRRRRSTFRDVKTPHPQTGIVQETEGGPSENGEEEEEGEDMGSIINEMPMSSDGYSSPDDEDDSDDEASASDDAPAPRTVFSASSQQRPFQGRNRMIPTPRRHGPGGLNVFAPNHATDHDEALRASLSTLLSCAAAARGLTKSPPQSQAPGQAQTASQQSGRAAVEGIRVVREGNLPSEASGSVNGMSRRGSVVSTADSTSSSSPFPPDQLPSRNTEKARKKTRRSDKKSKSKTRSGSSRPQETPESGDFTSALGVSYATLVISAGAIILISAITFSAGYAMGREVGKSEGGLLGRITGGGSGRGKAVVRGLSRASGGGLRGAAGRGISVGSGIGSVTA